MTFFENKKTIKQTVIKGSILNKPMINRPIINRTVNKPKTEIQHKPNMIIKDINPQNSYNSNSDKKTSLNFRKKGIPKLSERLLSATVSSQNKNSTEIITCPRYHSSANSQKNSQNFEEE
jgi:hypothetical protein